MHLQDRRDALLRCGCLFSLGGLHERRKLEVKRLGLGVLVVGCQDLLCDAGNRPAQHAFLRLENRRAVALQVTFPSGEARRAHAVEPHKRNIAGAGQLLADLIEDVLHAAEAVALRTVGVVRIRDRQAVDGLHLIDHADRLGDLIARGAGLVTHRIPKALNAQKAQIAALHELAHALGRTVEDFDPVLHGLQDRVAPQVLRLCEGRWESSADEAQAAAFVRLDALRCDNRRDVVALRLAQPGPSRDKVAGVRFRLIAVKDPQAEESLARIKRLHGIRRGRAHEDDRPTVKARELDSLLKRTPHLQTTKLLLKKFGRVGIDVPLNASRNHVGSV